MPKQKFKVIDPKQHRLDRRDEILTMAETGTYRPTGGDEIEIVNVADALLKAKTRARQISPSKDVVPSKASENESGSTEFEVVNGTTMSAVLHLPEDANIGVMNFASAKHPGGGFMRGSMAQEESLCLDTLLYPVLAQFEDDPTGYYRTNRRAGDSIYTDYCIWTPDVPVVRDTRGHLLRKPRSASFVTIPAPNQSPLSETQRNDPAVMASVEQALRRRIRKTLGIFAQEECQDLVLGAFGCGVFGNDPTVVASIFHDLLWHEFRGSFRKVVFAILSRIRRDEPNLEAFQQAFEECSNKKRPR